MSKSNFAENSLLLLLFNATAIANIADNAVAAPLTNLYVALHTADPGEGGSQTTNEAAYTSYARVAVSRDGAGWTVSGNSVQNTAAVVFPESTGGTETITHLSVGTAVSGAGNLLYSGALDTPLDVSTGIEPRFLAGTLVVTEE